MKNQPVPNTIAFDGPAASGKSTIAEMVALDLGYLFFDTGIMYRIVTLDVLQKGIDPKNEQAVTDCAENINITIEQPTRLDGRKNDVFLDGQDVTWEIRSSEVNAHVSVVSTYSGVRNALTDQQRQIAVPGRVVMVGRDIGTVVLPDADLKIYLEASAEERARRRMKEDLLRGQPVDYDSILTSIKNRDVIDSTRSIAPLKPAADAHIIQTDGKDIQQVLAEVKHLIETWGATSANLN